MAESQRMNTSANQNVDSIEVRDIRNERKLAPSVDKVRLNSVPSGNLSRLFADFGGPMRSGYRYSTFCPNSAVGFYVLSRAWYVLQQSKKTSYIAQSMDYFHLATFLSYLWILRLLDVIADGYVLPRTLSKVRHFLQSIIKADTPIPNYLAGYFSSLSIRTEAATRITFTPSLPDYPPFETESGCLERDYALRIPPLPAFWRIITKMASNPAAIEDIYRDINSMGTTEPTQLTGFNRIRNMLPGFNTNPLKRMISDIRLSAKGLSIKGTLCPQNVLEHTWKAYFMIDEFGQLSSDLDSMWRRFAQQSESCVPFSTFGPTSSIASEILVQWHYDDSEPFMMNWQHTTVSAVLVEPPTLYEAILFAPYCHFHVTSENTDPSITRAKKRTRKRVPRIKTRSVPEVEVTPRSMIVPLSTEEDDPNHDAPEAVVFSDNFTSGFISRADEAGIGFHHTDANFETSRFAPFTILQGWIQDSLSI